MTSKFSTFAIIVGIQWNPYVAFLSRINWLGVGMKHWDVSAHWSERQMLCSHSDSWIMKDHIQGVFSSLLYRQNVCSSRSVTQAVTVTCSHQGISHTFMVQSGSIWPPTKLAVGTLSEWRGDGGAGSDIADRVSSTLADVCYEYLPLTNTISSQFCLYLCHCRLGPRGGRRVIWGDVAAPFPNPSRLPCYSTGTDSTQILSAR